MDMFSADWGKEVGGYNTKRVIQKKNGCGHWQKVSSRHGARLARPWRRNNGRTDWSSTNKHCHELFGSGQPILPSFLLRPFRVTAQITKKIQIRRPLFYHFPTSSSRVPFDQFVAACVQRATWRFVIQKQAHVEQEMGRANGLFDWVMPVG